MKAFAKNGYALHTICCCLCNSGLFFNITSMFLGIVSLSAKRISSLINDMNSAKPNLIFKVVSSSVTQLFQFYVAI